jgi:hypothetical protein
VSETSQPASVNEAGISLSEFSLKSPAFIDFGCGSGNSMRFAQGVMRAAGVGIDRSATAIRSCVEKGFEAKEADVLEFDRRSVAPASFAIDVLPEVGGRRAFERAWVNVVRAARDFAVIQHLNFDAEDKLHLQGLCAPSFHAKSIQFAPRLADYLYLVKTYASSLNISGIGVFGAGQVPTEPLELTGLEHAGAQAGEAAAQPLHRSVRIIIGRKDEGRFRAGLSRAATGDLLLMWRRPE